MTLSSGCRFALLVACYASFVLPSPAYAARPTLLGAALLKTPSVHILLREPVLLEGLYGVRKRVLELTLFVDERRGLMEAFRLNPPN